MRLILENPQYGKIFVVRREGKAVGMVNLLHTISLCHGGRVLMLEDMIVCRDCRNQGIATALLAHAISYARSLRAAQITLFTDATNLRAIRFYQKLGFARSGAAPMRQALELKSRRGNGALAGLACYFYKKIVGSVKMA